LNANPLVQAAHHRVSPAGFKYLVTEQLCHAAGGPQRYTGRDMKTTHADLRIVDSEWQAFLDLLKQSLDKFRVPLREQGEIFAIVESTKADIVV
jgi:hemoglobin